MKQELSDQALNLKPGIYKHYKGGMYQVLGVSRHSETLEELVVYCKLYDDFTWWVRPLSMFLETIEKEGRQTPRFEFIGQNR